VTLLKQRVDTGEVCLSNVTDHDFAVLDVSVSTCCRYHVYKLQFCVTFSDAVRHCQATVTQFARGGLQSRAIPPPRKFRFTQLFVLLINIADLGTHGYYRVRQNKVAT